MKIEISLDWEGVLNFGERVSAYSGGLKYSDGLLGGLTCSGCWKGFRQRLRGGCKMFSEVDGAPTLEAWWSLNPFRFKWIRHVFARSYQAYEVGQDFSRSSKEIGRVVGIRRLCEGCLMEVGGFRMLAGF